MLEAIGIDDANLVAGVVFEDLTNVGDFAAGGGRARRIRWSGGGSREIGGQAEGGGCCPCRAGGKNERRGARLGSGEKISGKKNPACKGEKEANCHEEQK